MYKVLKNDAFFNRLMTIYSNPLFIHNYMYMYYTMALIVHILLLNENLFHLLNIYVNLGCTFI